MILGHALALAINRYDRVYKSLGPPLSLTHYVILSAISTTPHMLEEELPSIVGLESESVRLVLHRIYKRKLFSKEGRGKRKKLLLTHKGEDALKRSSVLIARAEVQLLQALPISQRTSLRQALTTLTASPSQSPSTIS
jgi:hypothetical protein